MWGTAEGGSSMHFDFTKLSAQRENGGLFQMRQDIIADAPEVFVNIGIGIPQDCKALFAQKLIPDAISLLSGKIVMLGAVQLDYQLFLGNVEIHDIGRNDLLAVDHNRQLFEKVIPQVPFMPGHIFAEGS